jgi:hypothetical protein
MIRTRSRILLGSRILVAVLCLSLPGLAYAQMQTTSPPAAPDWLFLTGVVLGGVGVILGGISMILHAIAPRTRTTIDDRAAAGVDAFRTELATLSSLLRGLAPKLAELPSTQPRVSSIEVIAGP